MPENPYQPPKEVNEPVDVASLPRVFWRAFLYTVAVVVLIDCILFPFQGSKYGPFPLITWMVVNLPGLPVALYTRRRTYGEPLRFILKSGGVAALHWGTIAGLVAARYYKHRTRPLSWIEVMFVLALNTVVPWLLVKFADLYEWDDSLETDFDW